MIFTGICNDLQGTLSFRGGSALGDKTLNHTDRKESDNSVVVILSSATGVSREKVGGCHYLSRPPSGVRENGHTDPSRYTTCVRLSILFLSTGLFVPQSFVSQIGTTLPDAKFLSNSRLTIAPGKRGLSSL